MATAKFAGTSITIELTEEEANLFAWIVSMWGPVAPTEFFTQWLNSRRQLRRELTKEKVVSAFEALNEEDKAVILTKLGIIL